MRDEGLAAVVDRLVYGHIDNVARDRTREDEIAEALLFEDLAGVFGAVDWSVDVDSHQIAVSLQGLLEQGLRVACSCIGNEDVNLTELFDYLVKVGFDGFRVCDVDAVCLGLDIVLFCEALSTLLGFRVATSVSRLPIL